MKSQLSVLHLEDDQYDAALVQATLREGGFNCAITRIETHASFISALTQGGIDLILADYKLPAFDGLSALIIAQKVRPNLPFIFVSGTLGEDQAIDTLKAGATDYVLKKNLSRLPASVHRAMEEVERAAARLQYETRSLFRKGLIIPPQRATGRLPRIT